MTIDEMLWKIFGYDTFREGQREIVKDILAGNNVVGMLPTGAGKSLCYQLPACVLEGSVVVISPLLSLMEDQVEQLRAIGEKRAIAFNSFRSLSEKKLALENLATYKFIFVSPEMLQYSFFFQRLTRLRISLFVIDEAHCISQWGHEFRPDYMKLKEYIKRLGSPTCLALTATATEVVLQDIVRSLGLEVVSYHLYSINRKNIAVVVEGVASFEEKIEKLLAYVQQLQGPGIIYCPSRGLTETLAQRIKEMGIDAVEPYHAGMTSERRMLIQQQFMHDQLSIITSTSAFGMGVNKPNVRYTIHFQYPSTIEAYLQEIGRCGRDGNDSLALLLVGPNDNELPMQLLEDGLPTLGQLCTSFEYLSKVTQLTNMMEQELMMIAGLDEIQWRFIRYHLQKQQVLQGVTISLGEIQQNFLGYFQRVIEERKAYKRKNLYTMKRWIETKKCRREAYLEIFGEVLIEKPEHCCDICGMEIGHYWKKDKEVVKARASWEEELQIIFGFEDRNR